MSPRQRPADSGPLDVHSFAAGRFATAAEALHANRAGLLDGDEIAVHHARVALRQLRSDLRVYPFVDREALHDLDADARSAAAALGEVRDLDVVIVQLRRWTRRLAPPDRPVALDLVGRATSERQAAAERLRQAAVTTQFDRVVARLDRLASEPALHPEVDAAAPVAPMVRSSLQRELRRNGHTARDLGRHPAPSAVHGLRKRVKRAHYAADALAALTGRGRDRRRARELGRIQDLLGQDQDVVTLQVWLRQVADRSAPARVGRVCGLLESMSDVPGGTDWASTRARLRALG